MAQASSASADMDKQVLHIENKPHQPINFLFPKREFGVLTVVKQSFQPCWFDKWPWLHYSEDSGSELWSKRVAEVHELDVSDPVLPRRRKVLRRYKIGTGEGSHPEEVEDYYRHNYIL